MNNHIKLQYILILVLFMAFSLHVLSDDSTKGSAGSFFIGEESGDSVYLTGFEWLQLNQASDNKIHLFDNQIRVTSPNLNWNGDILATQKWVNDNFNCPE